MDLASRLALDRKYALLLLTLLLAFALRMWDIDARSLWFDEAYEYWSASVDLEHIPEAVTTSFQPPLYTYLLHSWLTFSEEAIWLRFLSVMLSMLSMVGVAVLAQTIFGSAGTLIAALLMAAMPSEVRYAQEAAEYALMECTLVWGMYFLYQTFRNPTWKNWALGGFFVVLSIYSHYGASITVIALALLTFVENLRGKSKDWLLKQSVVMVGILVACLPLLIYFFPKQLQDQGSAPAFQLSSWIAELERFALSMGDSFLFPLTGWPWSSLPKWPGQIIVYSTLILSIIILVKRSPNFSKRILVWFWGTYITYYLLVRTGLYAYGISGFRYVLILSPLLVLTMVAGIYHLLQWERTPILGYALLAVVVGVSVYSLPNRTLSEITRGERLWPETEDLREVTQHWIQHRDRGDMTYVYYGAVPAFRYYVRLYGEESSEPLPPTWIRDCWGRRPNEYCSTDNVFYGKWIAALSPEEKTASIRETLGHMPDRFWMIYQARMPHEEEVVLDAMSSTHRVVHAYQRAQASAYLFVRR